MPGGRDCSLDMANDANIPGTHLSFNRRKYVGCSTLFWDAI